jgi:hypothetical protein
MDLTEKLFKGIATDVYGSATIQWLHELFFYCGFKNLNLDFA